MAHLHKMLHTGLKERTDLREKVVFMQTTDDGIAVCKELKEFRKDRKPEEKIGWYFRYWDREDVNAKAHSLMPYQEYIDTNPMF